MSEGGDWNEEERGSLTGTAVHLDTVKAQFPRTIKTKQRNKWRV